jgi:RNA polymerase sigma factor (sigma-70 family)
VASIVSRLLAQPPLTPERERTLARAARAGDRAARDALVRESLRLVALRARSLGLRGDTLEEAIQSGTLGLMAAVDRFDPDHGARLATYAWPWITAAIRVSRRADAPTAAVERAGTPNGEPSEDLGPLLAHLPIRLANVVRLRYGLEEPGGPPRSRREVALCLGLTEAQVRADEARAMRYLRARLDSVGRRAPRSRD